MQVRPILSFTVGAVTYYFSTEDVQDGTSFYEGRIVDTGTIAISFSELYYGRQAISPVTLKLDNSDRVFTDMLATADLRGLILTIAWKDIDAGTTYFTESFRVSEASLTAAEFVLEAYPTDVDAWESLYPKEVIIVNQFSTTQDETIVGKPVPVIFGSVRYAPLYSIYEHSSGTHDFLIGKGVYSSVSAVYRGGMLVTPSEYVFYDGSQGSPYAGYSFLRFAWPQRDTAYNLYEMLADVNGLEVDYFFTNPAHCFRVFLSDATVGLGLSVNTASFNTAASKLSMPMDIGACLYEQKKAADIRDAFLMACNNAYLYRNAAYELCLLVKEYNGTNSGTFTKYNMFGTKRAKLSASEFVKLVKLSLYWQNMKNRYEYSLSASTYGTFGIERDFYSPYSIYTGGGDIILRRLQNTYKYQDDILEFKTGVDGYGLALGSIITINYPEIGINNARYEIISISKSFDEVEIKAASYNSLIFS